MHHPIQKRTEKPSQRNVRPQVQAQHGCRDTRRRPRYAQTSLSSRTKLTSRTGTWQSKPGEVKNAVSYALQNGYKLIDGAYCYGNEDEVGEGLKEAFSKGVKREDVFVVSKVWATYNTRVAEGLDKSLKSLGLDYVDLYLIVSFHRTLLFILFSSRWLFHFPTLLHSHQMETIKWLMARFGSIGPFC